MNRLGWRCSAINDILPRLSEAEEATAAELKQLLNHDFMTLKDKLSTASTLPELRTIEQVRRRACACAQQVVRRAGRCACGCVLGLGCSNADEVL